MAIAADAVAQLSKLRRLLARRLSCVLGGAIGGAIDGAASAARLQLVKDVVGSVEEWHKLMQLDPRFLDAAAGALTVELEESSELGWDCQTVLGIIKGQRGFAQANDDAALFASNSHLAQAGLLALFNGSAERLASAQAGNLRRSAGGESAAPAQAPPTRAPPRRPRCSPRSPSCRPRSASSGSR